MSIKTPNILFIMVDQMAAPALPVYGHKIVKTPHIESLAEQGVVFENASTNFPLCAPARFSMLSGQLPSKIGAWDNGAEFSSEIPTLAHYLRLMGYRTCLSGKMHFVGADQLHGFEERLTTDICPADFNWSATWDQPDRVHLWFHTMQFAAEGGLAARSTQLDFDTESAHQTIRKIYEWARDGDTRPFFLVQSFVHPHDPYVTTRDYWNRYDHDEIDLPTVSYIPPEQRDPHSRRLYDNYDRGEYEITPDQIRMSRHGYYGNISFIDDKIGEIMQALEATDRLNDTIIVFTGDHGDMLGERGLWYKMSFYEWSSRVPMIISWPGQLMPRRIRHNTALIDLMPTILQLAGDGHEPELVEPIDGRSMLGLLEGVHEGWDDVAVSEYLCEAVPAPYVMLRRGKYKYTYCEGDPSQLFDIEADPNELNDLAGNPDYADVEQQMAREVETRWELNTIAERVLKSQRRRTFVYRALIKGRYRSWDYQPVLDAARQYYRGTGSYQDIEKRDMLRYPSDNA